ncbi:hypothetical protein Hamer_G007015 [Homarus americanus]|uniref:Uncharacterized protein n=1 Tax=Homarus americanus TaxID=6706 RepID=A0A8J5N3U7_HOMAM|nr:hypothetical protein Hamer_G007015 [Homarus americanus]
MQALARDHHMPPSVKDHKLKGVDPNPRLSLVEERNRRRPLPDPLLHPDVVCQGYVLAIVKTGALGLHLYTITSKKSGNQTGNS